MRKLIFLDKVVVYLKENLDKTREEVEENLEIIIKAFNIESLLLNCIQKIGRRNVRDRKKQQIFKGYKRWSKG